MLRIKSRRDFDQRELIFSIGSFFGSFRFFRLNCLGRTVMNLRFLALAVKKVFARKTVTRYWNATYLPSVFGSQPRAGIGRERFERPAWAV